MSPRALAAPLHRHHNEDEYSWIIEGRVGALLGDEVLYGGPGDFIFKPRGQWHTFWNAGDEPARILEIISPAGFEQFFDELSDLGGVDKISTETLDELCARYDLEMDVDSVPELCKRFDLKFPGEPHLIVRGRLRSNRVAPAYESASPGGTSIAAATAPTDNDERKPPHV